MYKCPRCGEVIDNINEPCPTCGLSVNNVNNFVSNKKINISLILFLALLVGGFLFAVNSRYNSKYLEYQGEGYMVNYATKLWSKYDANGYSLALQYQNSKGYLFFSNKVVDLNVNVDDIAVRNSLYQSYLKEFRKAEKYSYYNVISEIKELEDTDYYYLSAEFMKLDQVDYRGKVYFLFTKDGKCLSLILFVDNDNLMELEESTFDLMKEIKIDN